MKEKELRGWAVMTVEGKCFLFLSYLFFFPRNVKNGNSDWKVTKSEKETFNIELKQERSRLISELEKDPWLICFGDHILSKPLCCFHKIHMYFMGNLIHMFWLHFHSVH